MKLDEFRFKPKKRPWEAAEFTLDLGERLAVFFKHKGFRKIGAGHFSNVFSNGRNVIKVYRHDPAYERFLQYAADHPSKHFPHVLTQPKPINSELNMVQLERLYPLSESEKDAFAMAYSNAIMNDRPYPDGHPELASLVDVLRPLCKYIDENYKEIAHDLKDRNVLKRRDGTIVIADPFAG
jgi:hypothetical protein